MYFSIAKRRLFVKASSLIALLLLFTFVLSRSRLSSWECRHWSPLALISYCEHSITFKLFYHLGGNGPWIPRAGDYSDDEYVLPKQCSVNQVHMISRHAERYPTKNAGARHVALLTKLREADIHLRGSLSFMQNWTYFTNLSEPTFESLTTTGPYSGTLQSYSTGKKLRTRYDSLVKDGHTVNFWTCSSPRDVETARHFARGFFGEAWEKDRLARLHIIPEIAELGGDTLTPGDTCLKYQEDKIYGHDYGYAKLNEWQSVFAARVNTRLQQDLGGLDLSSLEIYGMMEMCGFEILAQGSSPWCDVFSQDEWLEFEYARDLLHYYRAGPGNQYSGTMGWLWLNATQELMTKDSAAGVYFSFVHDGDIVPLLATMGILDEEATVQDLPTDHIKANRRWRTSDVIPMGGRLIFEKISCDTGDTTAPPRSYIRLFINDGLFDLGAVIESSGLVGSVNLDSFTSWVARKGEQFGNFREVCGLSDDTPSRITFLQQQYAQTVIGTMI